MPNLKKKIWPAKELYLGHLVELINIQYDPQYSKITRFWAPNFAGPAGGLTNFDLSLLTSHMSTFTT